MTAARSPSVPEKIGKYPVESLLAQGGMGAVYKATHPELKRTVIIKKLMIRGNATIAERFKREARILMDLNNPRIVRLLDYFHEGSSRYLVLEFVDGLSLDKILARKKSFSAQMALLVILEVCMALKHAHDHGIVHRDIKPGNILVSRKGEIKLADFGIASGEESEPVMEHKGSTSVPDGDLTGAGTMLGTPSYMPPEQFADSSTVDKRADIYAVGVMLYEMLTGVKPFASRTIPETIEKIRKGAFVPVGRLSPQAPRIVRSLIRSMIRRDPRKRIRDLAPVIARIHSYLSRYQVREIRYALVRNMLTNEVTEPQFLPLRRNTARALAIAASVVAFSAISVFLWNYGYVHASLLRRLYAPLSLSMPLPPDAGVAGSGPDSTVYRVFFFRDNDDTIPEIVSARRILAIERDASRLVARPVWLRPGPYRIKITAGNRIWWHNIALGIEGAVVEPPFGRTVSSPVTLSWRIRDALTGQDISSRGTILLFHEGSYRNLQTVPQSELRSGRVLKFRFEAPGYRPKDFDLRVALAQTELVLEAALFAE